MGQDAIKHQHFVVLYELFEQLCLHCVMTFLSASGHQLQQARPGETACNELWLLLMNTIFSTCTSQAELSLQEKNLVRKTFALHFELHLLMDACRRGVRECAHYNISHLSSIIQPTLAELKAASGTCNTVVSSLVNRTIELYH